jgi:hypothetical protein
MKGEAMPLSIGNLEIQEQYSGILVQGEFATFRVFGGLLTLNLRFIEDPNDSPRWNLQPSTDNILELSLINHHISTLGGTTSENIILGVSPDTQFILRYHFMPSGEGSARTWFFTCLFGVVRV